MSPAILARDLGDRRTPIVVISVSLTILTLGALGAGAGLQETIDALTRDMPAALTAFIPADVPGGYVVGEVFNLIAPAVLVAYAVITGASAAAGEEDLGTMAILVSQPVSRRQVLASKSAGLLLALVVTVTTFGVVAWLASSLFGIGLNPANIGATCLHLLALAVTFGALALAVGGLTGQPSLASMIAGGAAALAYMTESLLPLAGLDPWARISPWHYYASSNPLVNGVDVAHLLVLLAVTAGAAAVAFVGFVRRDLRG